MKPLIAACAALGLAVSLASASRAAEVWKTQSFPELGFAIDFPTPTRAAQHIDEVEGFHIPRTQVDGSDDTRLYSVDSSDYRPVATAGRGFDCDRALGAAGSTSTRILSRTALSVEGGKAVDISLEDHDMLLRERVYCGDGRLITVILVSIDSKPEQLSDATAMRFFDSFRLLP